MNRHALELEARQLCEGRGLGDIHVGIVIEHAQRYGLADARMIAERIEAKLRSIRERFNIRSATRC